MRPLSCEKGTRSLPAATVGIWIEGISAVAVADAVRKGENVENETLVRPICVAKEESSIFC